MVNFTLKVYVLPTVPDDGSDGKVSSSALVGEAYHNEAATAITKIRQADVDSRKKNKGSWVSRLKNGVTTALAGPGHSPAGKKYLAKKRGY